MSVVDCSVWIDFFNGVTTPEVARLRGLFGETEIILGDLILCEVLQGFDPERDVLLAEEIFEDVRTIAMAGPDIARKAAENYRILRRRGVTVRKTIDVLIATFCIEGGYALLHSDRDFDPFSRHLGLTAL